MIKRKAIILLSGGLDSVASLSVAREKYDVSLALTFDYGQQAFKQEKTAAGKIAGYYNIEHKIIKLDWLEELFSDSSGWIPNRNALFINIAAAFADTGNSPYKYIIIGANKEEAGTFTDNSAEFIKAVNKSLKHSTNSKIQVLAPMIDKDKSEIIRAALKFSAPVRYMYSCYSGTDRHCSECESCIRLKRAIESLENDSKNELMGYLF